MVCFVDNTKAQTYSWENFVEKISVDEYDEHSYLSPMLEDLEELYEHPFNLNTATKEELEQLPFLDEGEIEEIMAYVYRYGPMQSLGELMLINKLDYQTRQFLSLFVYVAPPEKQEKIRLKTLWKEGRNELTTRLDVPLYKRDGYKIPDEDVLLKNPNKVYLGNSLYHNIKYGYKYGNRIFFGLSMEKDAGEPFGSYGNKTYDAWSFHFLLKDWGKLKILALGDYRLKFGEGLIVNTDFSFGKSSMFNMSRDDTSIKKFSSMSEYSYFRGVAGSFRFGRVGVSAFYSYLPVDATLRKNGTISSLKTDGLHRTLLEISKKHNVVEQSAGGDVSFYTKYFTLGATVFYQHFDTPFSKSNALYQLYYPEGKDLLNAGLHYRVCYDKFSFSGETAFSNAYNGWATLNKAVYRFNNKYSLVALYRLYSYQYVGLRSNAFSESGTVKNESGFYAGVEAAPLNELKLSAYVDYFYFPWVKFATPHTSEGFETVLQADWIPSRKFNVSGWYRLKRKERYGKPYLYNNLKMQMQYVPSAMWDMRLSGRYTRVKDEMGGHVQGYMAGTILKWKEKKERIDLSLSAVYFNSEDYKASMSFYEPSLLYAFSFMTMYGHGMRMALNGQWNITRDWMVMMKFGMTDYFDRHEIGEGLQRISGNWKNDISFLLRYKF